MEVDKTGEIEQTPEKIEQLRPRPAPKIPVKLIDSLKNLEGAALKNMKGTRSNHYIFIQNVKKSNIVLFTNQRIYKLVIVDAEDCKFCIHDSVVITTQCVELVNVKNCTVLFDEVDVRKINCFNCQGVVFQYQNENTLIDDMDFYWDANCVKNSVERIKIVPGTDPNKDPVLPVTTLRAWACDFQLDETQQKPAGLIAKSGFTTKALDFQTNVLNATEIVNRSATDVMAEVEKVRADSAVVDSMTSDELANLYLEEVREYLDPPEDFQAKVKKVAEALKNAKHAVLFTGAGISTSAQLPDYRGPRGAWTVMANKGKTMPLNADKKLSQALPTYAHYAVAELVRRGLIKYIVSTNMDGLHRRSGVPGDKLTEIHGNCYREICAKCSKEYLRGFDTLDTRSDRWSHLTGRLCSCGGPLRDTIVHFTENWSLPEEVERGTDEFYKSDVAIALGSSMLVQPAVSFPRKTLKNNGKMVIVTLQHTPYDDECFVKLYAKTDDFMKALMKELGIEEFDQTYDHLQHLPPDDSIFPATPEENNQSQKNSSKTTDKGCIIQ